MTWCGAPDTPGVTDMGWCEFCGLGLDEGTACGGCTLEYMRRQDAKLCVFCGKAPRVEFDWCGECASLAPRPAPYIGYPPEGA